MCDISIKIIIIIINRRTRKVQTSAKVSLWKRGPTCRVGLLIYCGVNTGLLIETSSTSYNSDVISSVPTHP